MAGKFVNNNQKVMIDNASSIVKSILNNPYYMYSDKKGSLCQYYNTNTTKTTLDEASRLNYSNIGKNSPIRFNLIHDFILYGIQKMDIDLDITEVGLESNAISGDAIVLPNTIVPYPGDYFSLNQIDAGYLFRVTKVDKNTLDTGAILYKIAYTLAYTDKPTINSINTQVVDHFNFILGNVGTNLNCIVQSDNYNTISNLEKSITALKDYFIMLFYDTKVQTFTYRRPHNGPKAYDSYLIEFIIRNKILSGSTKYINVQHQMFLPTTFGVEYDKTIFKSIEEKSLDRPFNRFIGNLMLIDQYLSLLYAYPEDYYYMEYSTLYRNLYQINIFNDTDILNDIRNKCYGDSPFFNIMIKYFNDENISQEDVDNLKNIDYYPNSDLFYGIPIAIFCLEKSIINLLS